MHRGSSAAMTPQNGRSHPGKGAAKMIKLRRVLKDYEDPGALHANIGVLEAIDENSFLTKAGHVFRMPCVRVVDEESLEPGQVDQIAKRVKAGLRPQDQHFRLYQYLSKTHA